MKKFYPKKDLPIEGSPLALQLQRRHTVVEGDKDKAPAVSKNRPVSRSNSTSSIYRPPGSAKDLSSQKGYLESTLSADSSGSSSASTVVITECQLSSSWLYNNKKAQMCPNETISAGESSSQQASDNEEARSPIIPQAKVKSVSSPNRHSKKCSSCCCYALIVILAGLAVMGIISTIGGIVYIEFFSGSNKTQTSVPGKSVIGRSDDLSYTKKIGQSLDIGENLTSQDLNPRKEISDSSSVSKEEVEVINQSKDLNIDNKGGKQGKGNILRVKKVKDIIPSTETDVPPTSSIRTTIEKQLPKDSNKKQGFDPVGFPFSGLKDDSPYSKLFELYKDIRASLPKDLGSLVELSRFEVDKLNPKITDLKEGISDLIENNTSDLIENNTSDLIENNTSDLIENNASELAHKDEIENDKHLRVLDVSFDTSDSAKEPLNPDLDLNSEASPTANEELSQPAIPKYFFQRPSEDTGIAFKNMFGINEHGDDSKAPPVRRFLPVIPQNSDMNDDIGDNSTGELDVNSMESFNSDLVSNLNLSNIPSGEVLGPAIPKNFFHMPSNEARPDFRNLFDVSERSDVGNLEEPSLPRFLPHVPKLSDPNNANDNTASNLDINNDNQESDLPIDLNLPVSEAKIAVPGPLDLIRRFATGRQPDNKVGSEEEQHDRRFFLAQALERLRSLDVRNILPSSRQKTDSNKSPKQKPEPKVQNEQEVVTERSTYLQKLRRHFFEK